MYWHRINAICVVLSLVLVVSAEAFFLKWGSDSTRQQSSPKQWVQPLGPNMSPVPYGYQYVYPYESRKIYKQYPQQQQYSQPDMSLPQSMAPIPISVPAGASLTPVSLQHVQLVPCMCPVAPEEADKLAEQVGPGPYLAQSYPVQQVALSEPQKTNSKQ